MAQRIITEAEWREIEAEIAKRPTTTKLNNGIVWIFKADGSVFGGMHPLTFLDICREGPEQNS